eukprot:gene3088-460_t
MMNDSNEQCKTGDNGIPHEALPSDPERIQSVDFIPKLPIKNNPTHKNQSCPSGQAWTSKYKRLSEGVVLMRPEVGRTVSGGGTDVTLNRHRTGAAPSRFAAGAAGA